MRSIPVMFIVLGIFLTCYLAMLAYRGQLTRYEEDQLFLSNDDSNEHREQVEIIRKVNRIQPVIRILAVATVAMTLGIIGLFTYDAWQRL